jgi:opine dehydrogenase
MAKKPTIAVLGGGNGAFAHAADLKLKGFGINLCEVPEYSQNLDAVLSEGGISLKVTGKPGIQAGFAKLDVVTSDAEEALKDADIVMIVVPSFAQRRFAEFCVPYLRSDQLVLLSPGNFGGSLDFWRVLEESGSDARPLLVETECMTYSGFKSGPSEVEVSGYKHGHTLAAFPGSRTAEAMERLKPIFPTVKAARNVLETGLRNVNTVMHAPIVILNAGRIENTQGEFLFYWQGATQGVGRFVDSVEAERIKIAEALGLTLPSTRDVLLEYYSHSGASGETLREVMSTNPVYEIDWAPKSLEHRFLTEDIPFGMVPMERMGKYVGQPTPKTTAVIEISNALLDRDLRKDARDLDALGLAEMSPEELKTFFDEGP